MSRSLEELKHEVLDLDDADREALVEALVSSLNGMDEIDRAWLEEVERRYEAVRSGKARLLEHDEVVARFEKRFG